jgi:hypothetical protein
MGRMNTNPHKWMSQIIHCISRMACYSSSVLLAPMSSSYSVVSLALCVVFNLQAANQDSSLCATCGEERFGLGKYPEVHYS